MRCLVLRALGLGDLLTGVPALRALRRTGEVVLATPAPLAPLVRLAEAADEVLPTPDLVPIAWQGPPPDLAVDLHGNGPASKRPLQDLRPGRLLAFAGPDDRGRCVPGPQWRRDEHEVARWCRLVSEGLGIPADPADLRVTPPDGVRIGSGPVVVHPGAASGSRRWPADRFARVAARLAEDAQDVEVVVTGGPDEVCLAEEVCRLAGLPPAATVAGRTDLLGLARLVAGARLVVCGDTGVAHLASAFGTPSVVLFGPIPPAWWGPPADGPHTVLWHGMAADGIGDPHGAEPDRRLLDIGVEEVLGAALSRLG